MKAGSFGDPTLMLKHIIFSLYVYVFRRLTSTQCTFLISLLSDSLSKLKTILHPLRCLIPTTVLLFPVLRMFFQTRNCSKAQISADYSCSSSNQTVHIITTWKTLQGYHKRKYIHLIHLKPSLIQPPSVEKTAPCFASK